MLSFDEVKEFLSSPKKIVITTHHKPDGDAMGSSLALWHYLNKSHHKTTVISPTDYPEFLHWMPGHKEVINFEERPNISKELVAGADAVFCLDFNKLHRVNELGEEIGKAGGYKFLIDHHLEPDRFPDYQLWDTKVCSTAELIYDFILMLGGEKQIDKTIATCIYTGLLTDTDRFRIPTTTPKVHYIAAKLMETGVEHTRIFEKIYETFGENRLRFFGFCFTDRMEVLKDVHTAIIAVDADDLKKYRITTGDTEGLVNYPLQIKGIKLAVIIIQRSDQVKLSFRSKGNIDVNTLAKEHFEGGGHKNAAGGKSAVSVAETKEKLISILARQKEKFNL